MKKILYVATVVKTHIMLFHIPFLKQLKEMGWETAVAAKNDYVPLEECKIPYCDNYFNIPFERSPFSWKNISAYKQLKKLIVDEQYDVIHCHTPVGGVLARTAARELRKRGTKIIYTAHGFHFFKGAPLKNWLLYYPVEWLCSFWTDVLITINREDYALAKKHMHAKKVEYIPGVGVDTKKFTPDAVTEERRMELRNSLGIAKDAFLLLSVGELQNRKNHRVVIEALHKLNDPHVCYVLAGTGELQAEYEEKIERYGLKDTVKLLGFRRDIPELCHAADCFVHPSIREGLGMAPLEAMACGLPLIAADINGIRDYAQDGVTGCCVDPRSVDGMCAAIKKMVEDETFRSQCGKKNLEIVKAFDLQHSLDAQRRICREMLERSGEK